jgi:hypothetical protein
MPGILVLAADHINHAIPGRAALATNDNLLSRLTEADVDFVIVGGVAVVLQASPRLTRDLDICYATGHDNLEQLGRVLVARDEARRRPTAGSG